MVNIFLIRALQNILKDLQKHNTLLEKWLDLQNQVSWEKDTQVKEFFSVSQPLYLNLQMLLQNVEQQVNILYFALNVSSIHFILYLLILISV